jgi:hypothetical protein
MSSNLGKLKPDIKRRWRAKLESGEYPQSSGRLKSLKGFCCLGVLEDLAVEDGVASWDNNDSVVVKSTGLMQRNAFPKELLPWAFEGVSMAGIPDQVNFVYFTNEDFSETSCLTVENDLGLSFPEISKLIEQHF